MSLATNIKQLRISNNMSQEVLAKKVGVCRQSISKWELGISLPDIEHIVILAKIFNTTIDFLVDNVIENKSNIKEKEIEKYDKIEIIFKVVLSVIIISYFFYKSYSIYSLFL